jgi:hypothetical protein
MCYYRDSFHVNRGAYQIHRPCSYSNSTPGPRATRAYRQVPEIEDKMVAYSPYRLTHGVNRVANALRVHGFGVRPSGVRRVWQRRHLETRTKRRQLLERHAQDGRILLSESPIELLERCSLGSYYGVSKSTSLPPTRYLPRLHTTSR